MNSGTAGISAAITAIATTLMAGPIAQVFDGFYLLMFISGGMGGMAFVLGSDIGWRTAPRRVLLGGMVAAGLGVLVPDIAAKFWGVDFAPDGDGPRYLAGMAFLVGFGQDLIVEFLLRRRRDRIKPKDNTNVKS